jgi:hypothetical protein
MTNWTQVSKSTSSWTDVNKSASTWSNLIKNTIGDILWSQVTTTWATETRTWAGMNVGGYTNQTKS